MPGLVLAGVAACGLALLLLVATVAVPARPRVERNRLDPSAPPARRGWAAVEQAVNRAAEQALRRFERQEMLAAALERAGVHRSPVQVVVGCVAGMAAGFFLGGLLAGPLGALALVVLVPVGARATLALLTRRRQHAFIEQLDDSLGLMASSMRAGHSVLRALDAVSRDAEVPSSEEFARVVNEVRVGRDLTVALDEVAERMGSDDFAWVSQAVAIHREVGGNLAEVLDRVGATIRERNQLRRQASALSAEGRVSAVVLLALPFVIGLLLYAMQPDYIGRLLDSGLGLLLLATAGVLMTVGALWVRQVIKVRY
jgi:tight adherence protein B